MANDLTQVGVMVLDTVADNLPSATTPVRVRKVRLVAGAAAAAATLCKAGGSVEVISLAAAANGADTIEFYSHPLEFIGLKLLALSGAGAKVYVYTELA